MASFEVTTEALDADVRPVEDFRHSHRVSRDEEAPGIRAAVWRLIAEPSGPEPVKFNSQQNKERSIGAGR
jgi:hypothetical protein